MTRTPPQPPVSWDATETSFQEDANRWASTTNSVWNAICASVSCADATFENAILPIARDENARSREERLVHFYATTSPSRGIRDAARSAETFLDAANVELYSRADMFGLVDAVLHSPEEAGRLDPESRHYLDKLHGKFVANGCALPEEEGGTREEFCRLKTKMQTLARQFSRNVDENKSVVWLTPDELEGVPESTLKALKPGQGENAGKLCLPLKAPRIVGVLKNAKLGETRRKVSYAARNRLPQNVELFRELVLTRDAAARLLGFPNHFALQTSRKMVGNPETVKRFIATIRERIDGRVADLRAELLKLKIRDCEPGRTTDDGQEQKLFIWDNEYYEKLRSQASRPLKCRDVSEYFELFTTLQNLLGLFGHMFDIEFVEITAGDQQRLGHGPMIWQEDVLMYSAWDSTTREFLGYAYLDLFSRDGKFGHGGCYAFQHGFDEDDGGRFYTSAAVVMNYSKAVGNNPTLLTLVEVRKLFHEIGHLVHKICTVNKYAAMAYVDRDFVEAPSLMFEQFFWRKRHIKEVSCHYSTISPEFKEAWLATLPEDTAVEPTRRHADVPAQLEDDDVAVLATPDIGSLLNREAFNVFMSSYDILVHAPDCREDLEQMDLSEAFNKLNLEINYVAGGEALGDGWKWSHGQSILRLIVNGYDGGYYSYVLGRVFALDMFNAEFADDTMSKAAGRKFRDEVLRFGGSQPEMKTLVDYLGHKPSLEPYLEWLCISGAEQAPNRIFT